MDGETYDWVEANAIHTGKGPMLLQIKVGMMQELLTGRGRLVKSKLSPLRGLHARPRSRCTLVQLGSPLSAGTDEGCGADAEKSAGKCGSSAY